tara:strand:+ start:263 stop:1156 length:894 start_codon:yes stop_codon:yes gene_type:complete
MSISRQNLTVIIVSFKSEKVIHDCINSIPKDIKIIIVDNSNNETYKKEIEKKYNNVRCILSEKNIGMGSGNNYGLNEIDTDFGLILNPDVVLRNDTIDEIILASKKIDIFAILAPIMEEEDYPNYKLIEERDLMNENDEPFKVESVDGFAMLLNLSRLNKFENFSNKKYFDENIFLYLENDDLCKRVIENGENIYIVPKSKIKHLGAKAVDEKYKSEIELSRNWHWVWSKFYFNKKHYGYLNAWLKVCPIFISAAFKVFIYFFINKRKKEIYLYRVLGFLNAAVGNKSFHRPKINDQ